MADRREPGGTAGRRSQAFWLKAALLLAVLVTAFFWSFFVGRYDLTVGEVIDILRSRLMPVPKYWDATMETIVCRIRFPRVVTAILVGGGLSVSGASYQTIFKNPMVSPDLLGVSAGASFGAALVMLYGGPWWQIQASAALCGLAAVGAAYVIGNLLGRRNITVLVLAGVVVSSLFQSLVSIVKTLADTDDALPSITFWLMGSLSKADTDDVRLLIPAVFLCLFLLWLFRHRIDAMAAGEAEAAAMGVNITLAKAVVILCSTVLTVLSVSICGIIGWVGLVVPHIARSLVGASYGRLTAASFLIGGLFLLLVDNMIRGAMAVDLPLGVMTALIGTPVFVILLARSGREWK